MHWRDFEPKDREAIRVLHGETEAVIGKAMDFPELEKFPVIMSPLLEDETGNIVGGFYIELIPEVVFFGSSARATAEAKRASEIAYAQLQSAGYRFLRCVVPQALPEEVKETVEASLAEVGFSPKNALYDHFLKDIRGER